jgi:hypothetical protein
MSVKTKGRPISISVERLRISDSVPIKRFVVDVFKTRIKL